MEIVGNYQLIVSIIFGIVGAIVAIITKVREYKIKIKNAILNKDYEQLLTIFNNFKSDILSFIEIAESSGMIGVAKKSYVKAQIIQLYNSQGLKYDDKEIDAIIERLIEFSKNVNKRGT